MLGVFLPYTRKSWKGPSNAGPANGDPPDSPLLEAFPPVPQNGIPIPSDLSLPSVPSLSSFESPDRDPSVEQPEPPQAHDQPATTEELSPLERRLRYRLWLQNHNEPVFKEDLEVRILLKGQIVNTMQDLHPEELFWQEERDRLIGEAISNRQGKEFPLDQLEKIANDLT